MVSYVFLFVKKSILIMKRYSEECQRRTVMSKWEKIKDRGTEIAMGVFGLVTGACVICIAVDTAKSVRAARKQVEAGPVPQEFVFTIKHESEDSETE